MSRYSHIQVTPSGAALGADVDTGGAALLAAPAALWEELEAAVIEHQVVRLRGLDLAPVEVVAVARRLGDPFVRGQDTGVLADQAAGEAPRRDAKVTDAAFPEIGAVSNIVEDGEAKGVYGAQQLYWHSDMVTAERPATYTVLYAVEAPAGEGQTVFASAALAAEALAPERLAELSRLTLKNSRAANAAGLIEGHEPVTDVTTSPGRVHPLVTRHPVTGRPVLFLGRRMHAYVPGLDVEASEALLEEVWAHATQPAFQWSQDWRPGDLVIFDNRGLLHKREPFSPEKRRLLQQVVLKGKAAPIPYGAELQAAS